MNIFLKRNYNKDVKIKLLLDNMANNNNENLMSPRETESSKIKIVRILSVVK